MQGAQASVLTGGRLHLHHGPIDLIIGVTGPGRATAFDRAAARFATMLEELVSELPSLRSPVTENPRLDGAVARRMLAATAPFAPAFITPMAAVAGAVADAVLAAMIGADGVTTAYVNNGGDVALHLAEGQSMTAAIAAGQDDRVTITQDSPVRGVATSGWRGRSHSLGIADAVTVLARTAAQADAAATMIANAVDLPHSSKITRRPAWDLSPDSDLKSLPVTVAVAPLNPDETDAALNRGLAFAQTCTEGGLILGALLVLGSERRIAGSPQCVGTLKRDLIHA